MSLDSNALAIERLSKTYGKFRAVQEVSLAVHAGKTTTLRILMGILQPSGGTAQIAPAAMGEALGPGLFVTRDNRETPMTAGAPLFAGDRLRAGTRGDLALADGSTVRLDSGTALVIAEPGAGQRARLELTAGRVFLRVAPAPGHFRLEAGAASVEVLGTVFGVGLENGAAVASVYEGRVRVATGAGEMELGRGESARADTDSAAPGSGRLKVRSFLTPLEHSRDASRQAVPGDQKTPNFTFPI